MANSVLFKVENILHEQYGHFHTCEFCTSFIIGQDNIGITQKCIFFNSRFQAQYFETVAFKATYNIAGIIVLNVKVADSGHIC